ncbi:hypothetical protein HUT11_35760 (plasmid) [Streptomyces seoulensis]|nr:hypothetical protein HUT11_35760 [Streptomyces seoulensis]
MTEQPIGPILDGLGTTIDLDEGDLVASAMVIAKVIEPNGDVSLSFCLSEGLSWVEQNGLLASAQQIMNQTTIGRRGDDA